MQSIEVDGQVLQELARRAVGFHVTPNDVLREILGLPKESSKAVSFPAAAEAPNNSDSTLTELVCSKMFQKYRQAIDRYLFVLAWLQKFRNEDFETVVQRFYRGNRKYFAKSEKEILDSGEGISAREIPGSEFWAMTTLDNKTKRLVLEDILQALKYSAGEIDIVLDAIPDSGIRRGGSSLKQL